MWGSRIKIFEKKTVLPHLCCVCKHFWYIHVLSGTSRPSLDSVTKKYDISFYFSQYYCIFTDLLSECVRIPWQKIEEKRFFTWAEKNSPSRRYVGWKIFKFKWKDIWIEPWSIEEWQKNGWNNFSFDLWTF